MFSCDYPTPQVLHEPLHLQHPHVHFSHAGVERRRRRKAIRSELVFHTRAERRGLKHTVPGSSRARSQQPTPQLYFFVITPRVFGSSGMRIAASEVALAQNKLEAQVASLQDALQRKKDSKNDEFPPQATKLRCEQRSARRASFSLLSQLPSSSASERPVPCRAFLALLLEKRSRLCAHAVADGGGVGLLTSIELEQPLFSHNSHPTHQRQISAFRCSAMEFHFSNARDPDFGKWPLWFSMQRAAAIGPCIAEFHSSALLADPALAMLSSKRTTLRQRMLRAQKPRNRETAKDRWLALNNGRTLVLATILALLTFSAIGLIFPSRRW
jgi:hypothetical protein